MVTKIMKNDNNSFSVSPYSCYAYIFVPATAPKNYNYRSVLLLSKGVSFMIKTITLHHSLKFIYSLVLIDITVNPSIYSFNNILFVQHLWCHFFMNSLTLYTTQHKLYVHMRVLISHFSAKKSIRCTRRSIFNIFCVKM